MVLNQTALEETVAYIKEHNIVLFIADPFVRTHEVEENANMQIDKVVWCFQRIADRTGCAIGLVHHTSKGYYDPGNADKSRGATSLINASRIAYTLSTMTAEETFKFSIPENRRKWYIRLDNAKANLQPPAEKTSWYEKTGIFLPNGDLVGAIKSADLRDLQEENARKEREASKRDIGALLNELMNTGEFLTINAVYEQAISDNRYTHLFEASSKTAIPLLISMLKEGLTFEDKCFIYLFESKKRIKHWIKCSSALEGLLQ